MTSYAPAEASERTGLSLDTLRYYERLGLFGPVERTAGGRRIYNDTDVAWLQLLICLRHAGLGITDLQRLIGNLRSRSSGPKSLFLKPFSAGAHPTVLLRLPRADQGLH